MSLLFIHPVRKSTVKGFSWLVKAYAYLPWLMLMAVTSFTAMSSSSCVEYASPSTYKP